MKPEEINRAVAECMGLPEASQFYCGKHREIIPERNRRITDDGLWTCNGCGTKLKPDGPNFFADLNACAEMEETIKTNTDRLFYSSCLQHFAYDRKKIMNKCIEFYVLNASAYERCAAFLIFKGIAVDEAAREIIEAWGNVL